MTDADRAVILDVLGQCKRAATDPRRHTALDSLAVDIISTDLRPIVMAHGLSKWMGLSPAAQAEIR